MAAKSSKLKKFVVRYAWAGPVVGFFVGIVLGPGSLWHWIDVRQKDHSITLEDIRLEKELYERQQFLLQKSSDDIITYTQLRDEYFASPYYDPKSNTIRYSLDIAYTGSVPLDEDQKKEIKQYEESYQKFDELRIRFGQQKAKLVSLISEYNQLEAKLSVIEFRQPSWFDLRIIPLPRPDHLNSSDTNNAKLLSWQVKLDPASLEARDALKKMFESYGQVWTDR